MDTQRIDLHLDAWIRVTEQLGWWRTEASKVVDALADRQIACERCLFNLALEADRRFRGLLNHSTRRQLHAMCNDGWTLRSNWPRPWSDSVPNWIGQRWYFGHASVFTQYKRFAAICCSQIGRWGHKQPSWPQMLDTALRLCCRSGKAILNVAGTTLEGPIREYCSRARLPTINLLQADRDSVVDWLQEILDAHGTGDLGGVPNANDSDAIWLSPVCVEGPSDDFSTFPLQDRVHVALADWIAAIDVRPGGTLDSLLQRRLADERFQIGSTFIMSNGLAKQGQPSDSSRRNESYLSTWLERGAVAWVIPSSAHVLTSAPSANCREKFAAKQSPCHSQSLAAPISSCANSTCNVNNQNEDPNWLTHCTRGWLGPKFGTSKERFWTEVWQAGRLVVPSSPFETLLKIIDEGCLRGSAQLYRSDKKCVSFSAVPTIELLSRRRFQSHLGRWDWEPYGIRIKRCELERLGARGVIYGTEQTYRELSDSDRLYFQPNGKRNQSSHEYKVSAARYSLSGNDWTYELEWRLLGDLRLTQLPMDAVQVFVETRRQAFQVSRHVPWPVLWLRD